MFINGIWIGLGIVVAVFVVIPLLFGLLYIIFGSIRAMFGVIRDVKDDIEAIPGMFQGRKSEKYEDEAARRKALGYDTPEQEAEARKFLAEAAARERERNARLSNKARRNEGGA
jgi:hypothetical protein